MGYRGNKMTMREIIGTIGMGKFILVLLASSFWIIIDGMPYVPLGLLIILYFIGKQELKVYLPFVIVAIIGFMGTGTYFHIYSQTRMMVDTGKTFKTYSFRFGVRMGLFTWNNLTKDKRVVIYNDAKYSKEVAIAKQYVQRFEKSYREHNLTFIVDNFIYRGGLTKEKLESYFDVMRKETWQWENSSYLGYQKVEDNEIKVFYNVEFSKDNKNFSSFLYRIILDGNESKLIHFKPINDTVHYKVEK